MITLKNPAAASEWIIDLKEYSQVENSLPMAGLNVRNDSNIVAYVDLDGLKVGEVQRYSADPFQGRNYSLIRIYNPDGQNFAPEDLFIQATKGEVMGSQPFNPQWDMMFDDLTRFATGTDSRVSISDDVDMSFVKYIILVNPGVIVVRRIDIQAHATLLGQVAITFNEDNTINTATGIGAPPPSDTQMHKATITRESFDYSETNAELIGFTVDYLTVDYPPPVYTVETGGSSAPNAYDGDVNNPTDEYATTVTGAYQTLWEVSFIATTLDTVYFTALRKTTAGDSRLKLEYYDGAWKNLYLDGPFTNTTYERIFGYLTDLNYTGVTRIRLQGYSHSNICKTIFTDIRVWGPGE